MIHFWFHDHNPEVGQGNFSEAWEALQKRLQGFLHTDTQTQPESNSGVGKWQKILPSTAAAQSQQLHHSQSPTQPLKRAEIGLPWQVGCTPSI